MMAIQTFSTRRRFSADLIFYHGSAFAKATADRFLLRQSVLRSTAKEDGRMNTDWDGRKKSLTEANEGNKDGTDTNGRPTFG